MDDLPAQRDNRHLHAQPISGVLRPRPVRDDHGVRGDLLAGGERHAARAPGRFTHDAGDFRRSYLDAVALGGLRQRDGERIRLQLLLDGVGRAQRIFREPCAEGAHRVSVEPLHVDPDLPLPAHLGLQVVRVLLIQRGPQDGDVGEQVVDAGFLDEDGRNALVHADAFDEEAGEVRRELMASDSAEFARCASRSAARDAVALEDEALRAVFDREEIGDPAADDASADDDNVRRREGGHRRA